MPHEDFTAQHGTIGRAATWAVFFLYLAYGPTTALGFLSLKSPQTQSAIHTSPLWSC